MLLVFTEVISHPIVTFRDVRFLKLTDLGFGSLSIILKRKKNVWPEKQIRLKLVLLGLRLGGTTD